MSVTKRPQYAIPSVYTHLSRKMSSSDEPPYRESTGDEPVVTIKSSRYNPLFEFSLKVGRGEAKFVCFLPLEEMVREQCPELLLPLSNEALALLLRAIAEVMEHRRHERRWARQLRDAVPGIPPLDQSTRFRWVEQIIKVEGYQSKKANNQLDDRELARKWLDLAPDDKDPDQESGTALAENPA